MPIANAAITVVDSTNAVFKLTTDARGQFSATGLSAGFNSISAAKFGVNLGSTATKVVAGTASSKVRIIARTAVAEGAPVAAPPHHILGLAGVWVLTFVTIGTVVVAVWVYQEITSPSR